MTNIASGTPAVKELTDRFVAIGLEQHEAIEYDDTRRFNRLLERMIAVEDALKAHAGDQRGALMDLCRHPNLQVRLNAAKATLAIAPAAARQVLQGIRSTGRRPQAGDAGMCLWAMEQGIFTPE